MRVLVVLRGRHIVLIQDIRELPRSPYSAWAMWVVAHRGRASSLRLTRCVLYLEIPLSLGGRERIQSGMAGQQGHANSTPAFPGDNWQTTLYRGVTD